MSLNITNSTTSITSTPQSIEDLLSENQGVVIGESHNDRASSQYLMESLETAKKIGVKYLFLEDPPSETYQNDINAYYSNGSMSGRLTKALRGIDVTYAGREKGISPNQIKQYREDMHSSDPRKREVAIEVFVSLQGYEKLQLYNRTKLFQAAHKMGIKIILIDSSALKQTRSTERLVKMNAYAHNIIGATLKDSNEKYIVVTGRAHSLTTQKVLGLGERLKVPVIHVVTNPNQATRTHAANVSYQSGSENYRVALCVLFPKAFDPNDHTTVPVANNNFF